MAIGVYFHPASMSAQQYDEAMRRLKNGQWPPPGLIHHACFGSDSQLMVFDLWESQEAFNKFGETLIPILAEIGLDPGQPDIMPVHNLEKGR
jgi:hypothetical protein